jgi:hypothetical protein
MSTAAIDFAICFKKSHATIKGEMNINLHEWLKILPFPVTSIDNTELMKNSKDFPFHFVWCFSAHRLNNHPTGGFGMASGETKNVCQ